MTPVRQEESRAVLELIAAYPAGELDEAKARVEKSLGCPDGTIRRYAR